MLTKCMKWWLRCLVWVMTVFGLALFSAYMALVASYEMRRKKHLEAYLNTPIPASVTEDLCARGLVPEHISECTETASIKRGDIVELFRSQVPAQATYAEVTQLFGAYELYCCVLDGGTYYCLYELGTSPYVAVRYDLTSRTVKSIE